MRKKIAVVITNRANFARIKSFLIEAKKSKKIDLKIILCGSALTHNYGNLERELIKNKLKVSEKSFFLLEGSEIINQAKTTGIAIIELSNIFSKLKPDLVITIGDRYETMATAVSAVYQNVPLAHVQGGEVSGNLDELVRHSITKLSSYHFATSKKSYERIIKMGEDKNRVFFSGCPGMDILKKVKNLDIEKCTKTIRFTGKDIEINKPYILIVNHPDSTKNKEINYKNIKVLISALKDIKINKIMFWPNSDAYNNTIASEMRKLKEKNKANDITYIINCTPEQYILLLKKSKCLVGNSSSFIREGSHLGKPAVIIGERQNMREIGPNVIYAKYLKKEIIKKIFFQIKKSQYVKKKIYGNHNAGLKIKNILEKINFTNKKFIAY
jgi:UDP-hydrolysing UDP-N-acetyl-D-glucosamine 2-epimerase